MEKLKKQNTTIKQKIEGGSEFTIVYCTKSKDENPDRINFQVVARVSEDIRMAIKEGGDRMYSELGSYKVVDRFYVKRCNKCQHFGHYEKDCDKEECCGYCRKNHKSNECQEVQSGDFENYECVNCQRNGKQCKGHSSLWHKCPIYLEQQKKLKKTIPFYNSKN